jgi:hypothetical protein
MKHILSDPCTELGGKITERTEKIFEITGTYDENFNEENPKHAE